jgi:chemotaxis-related protein WspB
MLFLLFQLGKDRYALEATKVAELLPLIHVRPIPQAHQAVMGVFNLRGAPVPVIDLSWLALGRPAERRMSTRIVLVHYPDGHGQMHLLGLVAEKATETMRRDPAEFTESGVSSDGAPWLGPVTHDAHGIVQLIEVHKLLPPELRDVLFQDAALT